MCASPFCVYWTTGIWNHLRQVYKETNQFMGWTQLFLINIVYGQLLMLAMFSKEKDRKNLRAIFKVDFQWDET